MLLSFFSPIFSQVVRANSSSVLREVERLSKLRHPLVVNLQRVSVYTFCVCTL